MNQEELKTLVAQMLRELAPQPEPQVKGRVPAHGIGIQADPAARGPRSAAAGHFGN